MSKPPKAKPLSAPIPPPPALRGRGRPRKVEGAEPVVAPAPIPRAPDAPDLFAGWIGELELARQRGVTVHALRVERRRGGGPPFAKDGQRVLYSVQGFRSWLASRQTTPAKRDGK